MLYHKQDITVPENYYISNQSAKLSYQLLVPLTKRCGMEKSMKGQREEKEEEYFSGNEFLQMETLEGTVLLAGEKGLCKQVLRINVVENEQIVSWVEAGDMVLTTGHPFRSHPEVLLEVIPALQKKGVCGLCIKENEHRALVSKQMIELANELDFPLIALPMYSVFSNITLDSMERILMKESVVFRKAQNQMDKLIDIISKNGNIKETVIAIESFLQNPVAVFDKDGDYFLSQYGENCISPYVDDDFTEMLQNKEKNSMVEVLLGDKKVGVYIDSLDKESNEHGIVAIFSVFRPISQSDILTISHISKILSLEMRNAEALKRIKAKYHDRFVQNWILGEFGNEVDICLEANADGYHLNVDGKYRVAIVHMKKKNRRYVYNDKDISTISRHIKQLHINIMFTIYEGAVVFVLEEEQGQEEEMFEPLVHRLKQIYGKEFVCLCVSSPYPPQRVPEAYVEVKKTLYISGKCNIFAEIVTREQLGIFSLLALLPDVPEIKEYSDKFLAPLKEYDAAHNTQLLDTLRIYLEANCNVKETAEQMFTHYNTIPYRLERIKKLLNLDLEDINSRLQILIAFKLDLMD